MPHEEAARSEAGHDWPEIMKMVLSGPIFAAVSINDMQFSNTRLPRPEITTENAAAIRFRSTNFSDTERSTPTLSGATI